MSKKIIVSVPDDYNLDNVVIRIKQHFMSTPDIAVVPVDYLTDIVPEIVEAILKTRESNNA